jgi:signal peptidase II
MLMKKKYPKILATAFIIVLLDQLTKFFVRKNFQLNESIVIIKNIFHLTYVTNTGSAFGLFKGINIFFIFFSVIVIFLLLYFIKKTNKKEKLMMFAFGLLLAGTVGNLIDRIIHGAVIDFIDFRVWPVFNIADIAITVSVFILIFLLWKN